MICDEAEVQTLKDVKVVAHLWYVKRGLAILCSMFCVFPAEAESSSCTHLSNVIFQTTQ